MSKIDYYSYGLKPLYNFDQFVIGPNNQFAVSACQAVAKSLGDTYNPLFVYGPPGVGKTHLVQSVAQDVLRQNPSLKVRYVSAERLMSEVIAAISDDNVLTARQYFSDMNLLIVDDVQYLTQSQSSQEELSHIFNNMQQAGHQLILACDRPPNQLTGLNKTLRSRLEGGLATDVKLPDINTRLEILRRKCSAQGLTIPDNLLVYVAQRLRSNVRELEGFIKRMHAYVTLSHQEVNETLVQSVVREVLPEGMAEIPPDQLEIPSSTPPAAVVAAVAAPAAPADAPAPAAPAPVTPVKAKAAPPPASAPAVSEAPLVPKPEPQIETKKNGSAKKHSPIAEIPEQPVAPVFDESPAPTITPAQEPIEIVNNQALGATVERVAPKAPKAPSAPPAPAPKPAPAPIEVPKEALAAASPEPEPEEEQLGGLKEIGAVFFYPFGSEKVLENVHGKFQDVIKKHKLKFRLKRVHSEAYHAQGKTNYTSFVDVCKRNKVPVAVVIGPPPDAHIPEQDFYDLLSVTLDVQGVSLQLINWGEVDKDYRYLNLALDIALVRTR